MIPILPNEADKKHPNFLEESSQFFEHKFEASFNYYFTNDAKSAIRAICLYFDLKRTDEVFISTTSDSSFVSSCVTSTIFNYSKVSRVLTEKTKLIFIIHEFGFLNSSLDNLLIEGKNRGIPVVNDCAHFFLLNTLGYDALKGDFIIHSLPKSFPVNHGGMLIVKNKEYQLDVVLGAFISKEAMKNFLLYYKYLPVINDRRKELFRLYKKYLNCPSVFEMGERDSPFVFGFKTKEPGLVEDLLNNKVELVKNHIFGQILLPLNPFVDKELHLNTARKLNKILI